GDGGGWGQRGGGGGVGGEDRGVEGVVGGHTMLSMSLDVCSPDGAKRNPGRSRHATRAPHCASLHAGYATTITCHHRVHIRCPASPPTSPISSPSARRSSASRRRPPPASPRSSCNRPMIIRRPR